MMEIDHPAEQQLFGDSISCQLTLPVAFILGNFETFPQQTEALLQTLSLVEESHNEERHDEYQDSPNRPNAANQRLEAKLDLVLMLTCRLLSQLTPPQQPPLLPTSVRWSRLGFRLTVSNPSGGVVEQPGVIRLQPADWLPDTISLPVAVLAEASDPHYDDMHHIWLKFTYLPAGLEAALDRHLFRLHRRQVAETRRVR